MTQSIESMIEVLQAYKDGKRVEYCIVGTTRWLATDEPAWQFRDCGYRIAPEPKKKVILEAWLLSGELRWFNDDSATLKFSSNPVRVPSLDKEIEL